MRWPRRRLCLPLTSFAIRSMPSDATMEKRVSAANKRLGPPPDPD